MKTRGGTVLGLRGDAFTLDGEITYRGRSWRGHPVEGLLMNARWVQAVFDDLNPATRTMWDYPDGPWDPERNVREFLRALPAWRAAGLLGFDVNLQGGNPKGYGAHQPWHNSAYEADGRLRPAYLDRLRRVLDAADRLGMVPMVGLFYFGQDERLRDEAAVLRAADGVIDWLLERGYRNLLVEIDNECDVNRYEHDILQPRRVTELVQRVRERSGGRFPVGVSTQGGAVPGDDLVGAVDVVFLHGNGVGQPDRIREMVDRTRTRRSYRGQPVVFNEDDHFAFDAPDNNLLAAVSRGASWGLFDWRMEGDGFGDGFQSVPVDWRVEASARKRAFAACLAELSGGVS